ncbi:hypothetical protein ACGF12_35535 [Kitasatospora sp. NPDC048296]|uniref:hypothetical protein n=1 Tax=Kitasatospora sp. NPDC048296 TaxID=3364048 RepID=UPI00371A535E
MSRRTNRNDLDAFIGFISGIVTLAVLWLVAMGLGEVVDVGPGWRRAIGIGIVAISLVCMLVVTNTFRNRCQQRHSDQDV